MDTVAPDVGGALQSTVGLFLGFGSDLFGFIVLAALVAAFAFYFGRDRVAPLIAGILAAVPLYTLFPYTSVLNGNPYLLTGLFVLLALLGLMAFSGLASFMTSGGFGFVKVLALSLVTAALLMAIAINVLPLKDIYAFSTPTLALFQSTNGLFWWLLAGVGAVFLFGK